MMGAQQCVGSSWEKVGQGTVSGTHGTTVMATTKCHIKGRNPRLCLSPATMVVRSSPSCSWI